MDMGEKFPKNPRNSDKIRFSGRQEKFHQRYRSPDVQKVWSELDFVKSLIISDLLKFNSLLRGMQTWSKVSCIFLNN